MIKDLNIFELVFVILSLIILGFGVAKAFIQLKILRCTKNGKVLLINSRKFLIKEIK